MHNMYAKSLFKFPFIKATTSTKAGIVIFLVCSVRLKTQRQWSHSTIDSFGAREMFYHLEVRYLKIFLALYLRFLVRKVKMIIGPELLEHLRRLS